MQGAGKRVEKEYLQEYASTNRDGCGILYVDGDTLKQYKSMNFDEFYIKYENICTKFGHKNILIHFRMGTSGKKDITNCHPFMCSNNVGFIHNGVIYKDEIGTDTDKSDTNLFNDIILKSISNDIILNKTTQALITDYIGNGNKLVFLNNTGTYVIINEDAGMWHDGVWYSNKWARRDLSAHDRRYNSSADAYYNKSKGCVVENSHYKSKHFCLCGKEIDFVNPYTMIFVKTNKSKPQKTVYLCESCIDHNTKPVKELIEDPMAE